MGHINKAGRLDVVLESEIKDLFLNGVKESSYQGKTHFYTGHHRLMIGVRICVDLKHVDCDH